jgi:serine/threonine protein kinase
MDRLQAGDPSQIGPFRLLGRLGEGGMGQVFLGQSRGGRKVAVKVVHPSHAGDPEFRRRFAHEVAAARQVGGFHTAAVVGADPEADPPWMATAYIAGPSLAEAVTAGGPLDEAGVRELGAALAEGLAAIHECGLIHRDLKPTNVILAEDGPRIIDFGIAKGAGATATALTGTNAVIGTLRYMSPEQLQGQELTPRSDVFALGTVLAYAATGRDPFQAPTMPAVITRILTGAPDLDPLSGDLRAVIADCLAKDPGDRPTPDDLLTRFSAPAAHDPTVTAAPVPTPSKEPVPAPGPVPGAEPSAGPRSAEADGPARAAQEPSLASTMNVSPVLALDSTEPPAARAAAALRPTGSPPRRPTRLRPGLIAAGTAGVVLAAVGIVTLVNRPAPSLSAAGPPPAASSATGAPAAGPLTATGTLTATLTDPASADVLSVAFGPGSTLAAGDGNHYTYLWDTATGTITARLHDPGKGSVDSVAFGPGGTLATGDYAGYVYLWNTATGKVTATLNSSINMQGTVNSQSIAFAPDGILASGDSQLNSNAYLWNTAAGKLATILIGPVSSPGAVGIAVNSVAFGADGTLATGDSDGSTYLWNTTTNKLTATLTEPGSDLMGPIIDSVAFGPNGILAAGDDEGKIYLWNTATATITATLTDPGKGSVDSVAFGQDGILAVGDFNGSTYLWNTTTDKLTATLTDPASSGVQTVAFGPGSTLATGDRNGSTYLWHITYG